MGIWVLVYLINGTTLRIHSSNVFINEFYNYIKNYSRSFAFFENYLYYIFFLWRNFFKLILNIFLSNMAVIIFDETVYDHTVYMY